jgi:site-specific DNA recombinase
MSERQYTTGIYGRTSKDDARRLTIENQQIVLRQWATTDPLVSSLVGEYWDDGVSGKTPLWERPAGRRLLEDAEAGRLQALAVVYADRFGRTLLDGLQAVKQLEALGVKLVAVNDGWDARRDDSPLYFQFRIMFAEEEYRRIRQRCEAGKRRAMDRDGAPPGGPLVFGYRMDAHGRFVPDPVEAPVVRRIFEMAREGYTNLEILAWVRTTGVPAGLKHQRRAHGSQPVVAASQRQAQWHPTKIGKILRNRVYIGERRWSGRVFPCEPLVSIDDFDSVQAMNRRRSAIRGVQSEPRCLLSGLLTCATCGSKYHHKKHGIRRKNGQRYEYRMYICDGARRTRKSWGEGCRTKMIHVDRLDAEVWSLIESYLADPEALVRKVVAADRVVSGEVAGLAAEEGRLTAELEGVEREAASVWEEQKANGWPLSWVTPRLNELNAKRERLTAALTDVRRRSASLTVSREQSEAVAAGLATVRARLRAGLSLAEKHAIARLVVAGGVVKTVGEGRAKKAEVTVRIRWGDYLSNADPVAPSVPDD